VIEYADRLKLVEAKSAQTSSASLFDGANRVRRHLDDPSRPCNVVIAYGGDDSQLRSGAKLISWAQLHDEKWG
jgi:hypothetical protein